MFYKRHAVEQYKQEESLQAGIFKVSLSTYCVRWWRNIELGVSFSDGVKPAFKAVLLEWECWPVVKDIKCVIDVFTMSIKI